MVAHTQALHLEGVGRTTGHVREVEMGLQIISRRIDPFQPVEHFFARLSQRRLRACLVLTNKALGFFNHHPLLFIFPFLGLLALFFLAHRLLETATVLGDLTKSDVDNRVGDPFQEIIVVGNHHRCPGVII